MAFVTNKNRVLVKIIIETKIIQQIEKMFSV